MPARLSAVDAVSPAFEHTKRQLFQPFRFRRWARLAVVSLVTGEFAGSSWGGGNVSLPSGGEGSKDFSPLAWLVDPRWERLQEFLLWIGVLVLLGLALALFWVYLASVFRFLLLDAVLRDRYELRAGWNRWQQQGLSYFLWQIGFSLLLLVALAVTVGLPAFLAWQAGVFRQPDRHAALLVLGGIALFFIVVGIVLLGALVALLAKDFVVPLMALENLGVMEGWRRFLPLLAAEKANFAGYVLMKIVLAIGSAILFGIMNLIVLLVLLIPLALAGVALVLGGKAAGLAWDPFTISAAVLLGLAALGAILYVISFISSPAVFFFQSYTLQFFGGRYPVLAALLAHPPASGPGAAVPAPAS
ncbi:MAG: hypothetical protein HY656_02995 [Acidobacteria bacterium]|nr:hypothetical protein [Acidobacteriota bacterium]